MGSSNRRIPSQSRSWFRTDTLTATMRPVHPLPLVAVVLATACCVLLPATARAQRGTTMGIQMPAIDLSSAPKDIQAIWKKLQSGGTPTPAEAQRLAQWMQ